MSQSNKKKVLNIKDLESYTILDEEPKKPLNIKDIGPYTIVDEGPKRPLNIRDIGPYTIVDSGVSKLESALRGAAQGATFGFADEITGGLGALKDIAFTDKTLSDFSDLYVKKRDESREAYRQAQEANPKTFTAGMIGGGVATSLVPVVGAATTVGRGATITGAAAKGALSGGLYGAGTSEGDSLSDVAADTIKGGALGAAIGGAVGALQNAAQTARSSVLKGLGADKARLNKIASRPEDLVEAQKRLANTAVKYRLLGGSADDIAKKVAEAKTYVGKQIGGIIDDVSKNNPNAKIDTNSILEKLKSEWADELSLNMNRPQLKVFQDVVDDIKSLGEAPSLKQVKALQEGFSRLERRFQGINLSEEALFKKEIINSAKKTLNESIYDTIKTSAPDLLPRYRNAILDYKSLSQIEKFTNNKLLQEGNRLFGLTDYVVAGGGIASGDPFVAGGAVLGKKLVENASPLVSSSLFRLTEHLDAIAAKNPRWASVLSQAMQRGPQSGAAAYYLLYNKDREFREFMKNIEEYNRRRKGK
jgi:hypothetical protein